MARNTHISGHTDRISGLVRHITELAREVRRLRTIVMRDALTAHGYRLEHRPEANPPGLYIVNTNWRQQHGEEEADDGARFLCP